MAFTCTKMSKTITLKNNMEMQWTYENQTFKNEWKLSVGIDKITKNISLSYFESSLQISTYLDIYPVNDMQYICQHTLLAVYINDRCATNHVHAPETSKNWIVFRNLNWNTKLWVSENKNRKTNQNQINTKNLHFLQQFTILELKMYLMYNNFKCGEYLYIIYRE